MKIGTNAMCELEETTGKSIAEIGKLLVDPTTATVTLMRRVFMTALLEHQEGISLKQAGDIIDDLGIGVAGQKLGEAFQAALPKAKEGGSRPPKAPTAG
ncbi:MAG: hypothetical protein EOS26_25065 [Mesorhizobium sp.]|nr:MAG: hypothetical protein EOS26_25065 [Mesorhizobium sp.]